MTVLELDRRAAPPSPAARWSLALAVAALLALHLLILAPPGAEVQPDSGGYLVFSATRPVTYPALLAAVRAVTGDHEAIVLVQVVMMLGTAAWLAREVGLLAGSWLVVPGCLAAVGLNVELMRYAYAVLTEAAFVSCVMAMGAAALRFLRTGSTSALALCALAIGAAAALRLVGLALAPLLPILLAMRWRTVRAAPLRAAAVAAGPVALAVLAANAGYAAVHGDRERPDMLGLNLVGKTAYVPGPASGSRYPAASAALEAAIAPVRAVAATLEGPLHEYLFKVNYYDAFRFRMLQDALAREPAAASVDPWVAARALALERIAAHPAAYARDVALNVYAMQALADLQTPATMRAYLEAVDARITDPAPEPPHVRPRGRHPLVVHAAHACIWGANLAGAFAALAWLLSAGRAVRRPAARAIALVGFATWGYAVAVSLVQAGIPRYSMMMWPLQVAALALLLGLVLHGARAEPEVS